MIWLYLIIMYIPTKIEYMPVVFQDPHAYIKYEIDSLNLQDQEDWFLHDAVGILSYKQAQYLNILLRQIFMSWTVPIDEVMLTAEKFSELIKKAQNTCIMDWNKTLH